MNNQKTISKLEKLITDIQNTNYDDQKYIREEANSIIKVIFGEESLNYKNFIEIHYGLSIFTNKTPNSAFTNNWEKNDKKKMIAKLKGFITELELMDEHKTNIKIMRGDKKEYLDQIFIVHGHDNEMKLDVARTIEHLDYEPMILHEQPNKGKTIIEKFENYSNVGYVIILLSPDDRAKDKDTRNYKERARQNVVFEFGYFVGKLGRGKVFVLYKESDIFEIPSDLNGLIYTPYDNHGAWKNKLVQEMKDCGYQVDANKLY